MEAHQMYDGNAANLGTYLKDIEFTLIVTMGISIEAYFLFSGLLLVYPRFRRNKKHPKINVIKIILRRYIRLCPSLLFILGLIVVLPLVGSGPVWTDIFDKAADNARKWWWTYVLMFNNFLAVKDQRAGKTPFETLEMLSKMYSESTVTRSKVYKWHRRLKEGLESIEDYERVG
ncbi:hypothetical protein TNCV_942831 [Trichonephila clavipes]|nr:hypothetical protein TNCV_942831 [Trichonephila clavipes]